MAGLPSWLLLLLVLEGALVVLVLLIVVAGAQLPSGLLFARLTPDVVLIAGARISTGRAAAVFAAATRSFRCCSCRPA